MSKTLLPSPQDISVDFNESFDDPFASTPKKLPIQTPISEGSVLGESEKAQFQNKHLGKHQLSLDESPINPTPNTSLLFDSASDDDSINPHKALFSGKEYTSLTEESHPFAPTTKGRNANISIAAKSSPFTLDPSQPTPTTSHTSQSHVSHLQPDHSNNNLKGHLFGRGKSFAKSSALGKINQKFATLTTPRDSTSPELNDLPASISTSSSSSDEEVEIRNLSFNEDLDTSQSALVDPYDVHTVPEESDSSEYMYSDDVRNMYPRRDNAPISEIKTTKDAEIFDPSFHYDEFNHDDSFTAKHNLQGTSLTLTADLIKKILKALQKSSISDENIYLTAFHKSLSTRSEKEINDACQTKNPALENLLPRNRNNTLTLEYYQHPETRLTIADGKISGNPTAESILPFVRIINGLETEYLKSLQVEMMKKALRDIKNSKKYPTYLANFRRYVSDLSDDEIENFCDNPDNAVTADLSISLDEQDESLTLEYSSKEGRTSPKIIITKDTLSSDQTEDPSPEAFLPFIKALQPALTYQSETFKPIKQPEQAEFSAAESLEKKLKEAEAREINNSPHSTKVIQKTKKALLPSWHFFTEVEDLSLLALQNRPKQEVPTDLPILSTPELNQRSSSLGALLLNNNLFNNSAAVVATNDKTVEEILRTALNITAEDIHNENKLKALAALLISESAHFSITKEDNKNIFKFTFPEPIDTIESHKGDIFRKRIEINLIVNENGQAGFTSNGFTNYAVEPETAVNVNDSNAKEILRKVAKFIKQTKQQNKFSRKLEEALSKIENPVSDNVDQVLKAIEQQEQEEESLCSKIKVSKITTVEIPELSRLNQTPPLTIFRPELTGSASAKPSNFDFSTTKEYTTLQSSKDLINKALAEAMQKSDVTQEEAAKLILIAIKNGGINNAKEQLALDLGADNSPEKIRQAVNFSKIFQKEMQKSNMFTGNQNAKELVGMRLKRLTPDYALDLLQKSNKHVQPKANSDFVSMWNELGMDSVIKTTPIVEPASPSATSLTSPTISKTK